MTMELKEQIRKFIESNLVVFEDEAEFSDSDNIFQMGFVNSLFAMKLGNYIEENFNVQVANDDREISNFSSVDRITQFIETKRSAAA